MNTCIIQVDFHFYWSSKTDKEVSCCMFFCTLVGGQMANRWEGWEYDRTLSPV